MQIMFIFVDSKEGNLAKPFLTMFGLEPEQPLVTAFDNNIGSKHLLEAELTPENLEVKCWPSLFQILFNTHFSQNMLHVFLPGILHKTFAGHSLTILQVSENSRYCISFNFFIYLTEYKKQQQVYVLFVEFIHGLGVAQSREQRLISLILSNIWFSMGDTKHTMSNNGGSCKGDKKNDSKIKNKS